MSNELVTLLENTAVDLVITDFNMPADSPYGDGLKLVEYLVRRFPKVRVLVLTMISNPLILTRLQELGVLAVIQKNQLHNEIQAALKAIARGNPIRSSGPLPTSVMESGADLNERAYPVVAQGTRDPAFVRGLDKVSMKSRGA